MKPLRLPWSGRNVPSALLDVIRGCNCRCKACFNRCEPSVKPLDEIRRELDQIMSSRNVQSVAISGGEPLLHPEVARIVQMIRAAGLDAAMLTNGVLWNDQVAARLADAGLGYVMFHVQPDQVRPDLAPGSPLVAAFDLLAAKCGSAAAHGIEALSIATVNVRSPESVLAHVDSFLGNPHCAFAWLTLEREMHEIDSGVERLAWRNGVAEMSDLLASAGWRPFAGLGGFRDRGRWRWMAYHAFVRLDDQDRVAGFASVPPSWFERSLFALCRLLHVRVPYHVRSSRGLILIRLTLNALSGGPLRNLVFVLAAVLRRQRVMPKHIVVEALPELTEAGEVEFCSPCVDATIYGGQLVPPCLIDTEFVRKGLTCA